MLYKNLLTGLTLFFITAAALAQEQEQAAWMEFMTPGPFHELLQQSDGEWAATITFWNQGEKGETAHTTCTNSMILGGRYQQSVYKGMMMGMPFEGVGTTAYDNARKVFLSTWIDNMGTSIMYAEGQYDSAKKQIAFQGYISDPQTGALTDYRETFTIADPDRHAGNVYDGKKSGV